MNTSLRSPVTVPFISGHEGKCKSTAIVQIALTPVRAQRESEPILKVTTIISPIEVNPKWNDLRGRPPEPYSDSCIKVDG